MIFVYKCCILEVPICGSGCTPFIGLNLTIPMCPIYKDTNGSSSNSIMYYFPIRERLLLLMKSDLFNFFNYPQYRRKPSRLFYEDIYDGSEWKWFQSKMSVNERLIGLQMCWDGVDRFSFSGKSMWPLAYSILNFPKDLRSKLFIGLFVASLCEGMF